MAEKYEQIRAKLEKKLFTPYGKSVTFKKKGTPILNSRDEPEGYNYTDSTIKIVPYNIIAQQQTFQEFGTLNEGEMDAAVSYSVDIEIEDRIILDGDTYEVKELNKNWLPENVVYIFRMTKTLSSS